MCPTTERENASVRIMDATKYKRPTAGYYNYKVLENGPAVL